ncbi:MAG: hypothetical protein U1F18_13900 [Steroidobacteraceae bacterium]
MFHFRTLWGAALLAGACLAAVEMAAAIAAAQPSSVAESSVLKQGRILYLQCTACHDLAAPPRDGSAGATIQKVGPSLLGVIGRRAGDLENFAYSAALRDSRLTWDEATLDRWIEKPTALVPGTTMIYVGMPKAADRRALIAYIRSARPAASR